MPFHFISKSAIKGIGCSANQLQTVLRSSGGTTFINPTPDSIIHNNTTFFSDISSEQVDAILPRLNLAFATMAGAPRLGGPDGTAACMARQAATITSMMHGIDRVIGDMPALLREFGVATDSDDAVSLQACAEMLPLVVLENKGQPLHYFTLVDHDGCTRLRHQLAWLFGAAKKPWVASSPILPPLLVHDNPLGLFLSISAYKENFEIQCFGESDDGIRSLMNFHNKKIVLMKEKQRAEEAQKAEEEERAKINIVEKWDAHQKELVVVAKQNELATLRDGGVLELKRKYKEIVGADPPIDPSVAALASELSVFAPEKKQRVLRSTNTEAELKKKVLRLEKKLKETYKRLFGSLKSFKAGCNKCGFAKKGNGGVCYNMSCQSFKNAARMKNELIYDAEEIANKAGVPYP